MKQRCSELHQLYVHFLTVFLSSGRRSGWRLETRPSASTSGCRWRSPNPTTWVRLWDRLSLSAVFSFQTLIFSFFVFSEKQKQEKGQRREVRLRGDDSGEQLLSRDDGHARWVLVAPPAFRAGYQSRLFWNAQIFIYKRKSRSSFEAAIRTEHASSSDDNSNQSSIADSSPVKQENSCSTSPAPENNAATPRENSETKSEQSPDSKRGQRSNTNTSWSETEVPSDRFPSAPPLGNSTINRVFQSLSAAALSQRQKTFTAERQEVKSDSLSQSEMLYVKPRPNALGKRGPHQGRSSERRTELPKKKIFNWTVNLRIKPA